MGLIELLEEDPKVIVKISSCLNLLDNMRLSVYLREEGLLRAFHEHYPHNAKLVERECGCLAYATQEVLRRDFVYACPCFGHASFSSIQ